jgi:hypothetical protein
MNKNEGKIEGKFKISKFYISASNGDKKIKFHVCHFLRKLSKLNCTDFTQTELQVNLTVLNEKNALT